MLQKPTAAFARDRIRLWRDSSLGWFCAADPSNSVLTGDPQRQGEIPLRQKYVISNHTLRGLAESKQQKWDSSGEFIPQQTLSRPCQVSLNFELGSSWNQEGKMKGKKCHNQGYIMVCNPLSETVHKEGPLWTGMEKLPAGRASLVPTGIKLRNPGNSSAVTGCMFESKGL